MADLKLQILMQAVDRISAPFRGVAAQSQRLRSTLGQTADKLKGLEAAAQQLEKFKALRAEARANAAALDKAKAATGALARTMKAAEAEAAKLAAEKKQATTAVKRLESAMKAEGAETAKLAAEHAAAVAKLKNLAAASDAAKAAAKKSAAAFKENVAEIRTLETAAQGGAAKLTELRGKLAAVGVDTKKMADGQRKLKSDMAAASAAAERQGAALTRLQARMQATAAARAKMERTQAMAGSMAGAGAAGMGTGGAGLALGARTAMIGMDFEAMMSKVGALAKVEKTSAEFAALEKQAFDLGATTSFSASQAAEAMSNLAMAGFDANKILGVMPGMLNLAKAGSTELAETASITANIMAGFKLDASQMGDVGDTLAATFTGSNTNLQMLGETMKYVAPIASAVGYSLGDMSALVGLLGNVGIQGSEAGTAMRAAMIRLAAPPKEAKDHLEELGVATKTVAGDLRPMASVLAEIAEKTKKMGNAEKIENFSKIFGVEAAAAMTELITQAGSDGIKAMTKTINAAKGLNDKISAQMADNAKGDLDNLSSAAEGVAIILTKINTEPLRQMLQYLSGVTTKVGEWMQANPELTATLTQVAAVIAAVIVGGGALAIMIAGVLGPFAMARYAVTSFGLTLQAVGAAAAANPIGLTVMAIAATAAALIYWWEPISGFFSNLFTGLQTNVATAWEGLKATLGFDPLAAVTTQWAGVAEFFAGVWSQVSAIFETANALISQTLGFDPLGMIRAAWAPVADFFADLWTGILGQFAGVWDAIEAKISGIRGVFDWAGGLFGGSDKKPPAMTPPPTVAALPAPVRVAPVAAAMAAAVALPAAAAPPPPPSVNNSITINITAAPGMDEAAIGQEVRRQIEEWSRKQQRSAGGALYDP